MTPSTRSTRTTNVLTPHNENSLNKPLRTRKPVEIKPIKLPVTPCVRRSSRLQATPESGLPMKRGAEKENVQVNKRSRLVQQDKLQIDKKKLRIDVKELKKDTRVVTDQEKTSPVAFEIVVTTPRKPCSPGAVPLTPYSTPGKSECATPTIYSSVKSIFQRGSSAQGRLLCRDNERDSLFDFLNPRIRMHTSGSLYISGPPGTGKSALTAEVVSEIKAMNGKRIKIANINCMTVQRPELVFRNILKDLTGVPELPKSESDIIKQLEEVVTNTWKSQVNIVILDEMDYLITKDQDILYRIFEYTRLQNSNLVLIGIANALNLTTRFLPKLKARNFIPELLRFTPYSADQIAEVIKARLEAHGEILPGTAATNLMHPAAIQLCSRKTASNTGDLRKAFDICKRGLDLAEDEARRKYGGQAASNNAAITPTRTSGTFVIPEGHMPPKVTIAHIAKICSTAFGGSTVSRVQSLNLQQKAVLCALVTGERKKTSSLTIRELFEYYGEMCSKDKLLDSLKISEFTEVVNALEANGAVNLSRSGGVEEKRVSAAVHEIELLRAVEDVGMLKRFFSGN
ncbi:P-loop containing nucleoside triphosphate hydrolase protein [Lipomyces japonicus]|uniref:P-loop containing nucleoside triphosphate hydrolase protein n=1 Tax=Lipomyces japonicus TaxID=56871 RepID=UPI0034CE3FE2